VLHRGDFQIDHICGQFINCLTLAARRQFPAALAARLPPSLKKYASDLGLDRAKFDAALDRGVYAAEVKKDISDGELYGVGSTPTIFVNGVQLRVLSADGLRAAIDRASGSPVKTVSSQ